VINDRLQEVSYSLFHCGLIVVDKFDIGREPAAPFPWHQNKIQHSTRVRNTKRLLDEWIKYGLLFNNAFQFLRQTVEWYSLI